jgi:hypothetical protein
MTNQEIFDKVVHHLLTQGKPALEGGSCRYRTADGLKCAIGCLITDDAYDASLEGRGIVFTNVLNALTQSGIPVTEDNGGLLIRLQSLHDYTDSEMWGYKLQKIARNYKLQYNPPAINNARIKHILEIIGIYTIIISMVYIMIV